ncbi:hypothetical protein AWN90_23385 [Nocardia terpenica]|uniref:Uncharacterized protein n=1 Tax=Nocardia terpenica TaxID=455432 RepID=A0A164P0L9_9NOCA|nr:hypothetical protein AWN90_23385 [Nocardia terpenica]
MRCTASIACNLAAFAAVVSARSFAPLTRPGRTDSLGLSGSGAVDFGTGGTATANASAALYIESSRNPADSATCPVCSPA